jgi:outer membrane protein
MFQPSWPIVLAILSALLVGCATSSIEMAPDRSDRPWVPPTDATGEIIPGVKAAPAQSGGATHVLPPNSELAGLPSSFALAVC